MLRGLIAAQRLSSGAPLFGVCWSALFGTLDFVIQEIDLIDDADQLLPILG